MAFKASLRIVQATAIAQAVGECILRRGYSDALFPNDFGRTCSIYFGVACSPVPASFGAQPSRGRSLAVAYLKEGQVDRSPAKPVTRQFLNVFKLMRMFLDIITLL